MKLALALLAAAGVAQAQTPPLEFKGVQLGAAVADLKATMPQISCSDSMCRLSPWDYARKQCPGTDQRHFDCMSSFIEPLKFGPAIPTNYTVMLRDGLVMSVTIRFPSVTFSQMVLALSEKYGAPTTDRVEPAQNAAGATFDNRVATWERPDGRIKAEQLYLTRETSGVSIHDARLTAAWASERATKAKASSKGL